MKLSIALISSFAAFGVAQATTIGVGGGTAAAQFVTSTGVILSPSNATVHVGTYIDSVFRQFAVTDSTPMTFATTGALQGRLSGNWADTSNEATAFNGAQVWFRVSVDLGGGIVGTAFFAGANPGETVPGTGTVFPNNGNGVGDSLNYDSRNLTILGEGSERGSAAYNALSNTIVIGVIPEPSTALLGLLGTAGLLRRRRR